MSRKRYSVFESQHDDNYNYLTNGINDRLLVEAVAGGNSSVLKTKWIANRYKILVSNAKGIEKPFFIALGGVSKLCKLVKLNRTSYFFERLSQFLRNRLMLRVTPLRANQEPLKNLNGAYNPEYCGADWGTNEYLTNRICKINDDISALEELHKIYPTRVIEESISVARQRCRAVQISLDGLN